ncbi:hypothetical protein EPN44_13225 [bacterium]|nr:MAG: hypothetical protein EPN44_13225 [bacterium]
MHMPTAPAGAQIDDHATPDEAAFVDRVATTLLPRYATAADAEKAGYVQTTGIEEDGTAVFFNRDFKHVDEQHPNFLWFDRHNNLVGLDYEFPQSEYPKAPVSLFPVQAGRWTVVHEHVHFGYRVGSGAIVLRGARAYPNLRGDRITAAALRADHLLPAGATLVWAYHHPACWDLGFWLIPNADGAFAERNPDVK